MSSMNDHSETPPGWGSGVYRATQLVAAELAVDENVALLRLVDRARAETKTLHDIADDVIAERLLDSHKAVTGSLVINLRRQPDGSKPSLEEDGSVHRPQPFPSR